MAVAANALQKMVCAPRHVRGVVSMSLVDFAGKSMLRVVKHPGQMHVTLTWQGVNCDVRRLVDTITTAGLYILQFDDQTMLLGDSLCAARDTVERHRQYMSTMLAKWNVEEHERYQQRRQAVGLPRLEPGAKRYTWDEEVRLKYREVYGPDAYADERKKDLEELKALKAKWSREADVHVQTLRSRALVEIDIVPPNLQIHCASLATAQYLFCAYAKRLMKYHRHGVLSDYINSQCWVVTTDMSLLPLQPCVTSMLFPFTGFVTKLDAIVAEKKPALADMILDDASIQVAASRFANRQTYLQNTYCNGVLLTDMALADMNGDNGNTPALIVLAQVVLHAYLDAELSPFLDAVTQASEFLQLFRDFQNTTDGFVCTWNGLTLADYCTYLCTAYTELGVIPDPDVNRIFS